MLFKRSLTEKNVFCRASFYLIDLVSITSMAIWRGGLTWNYQFIHQDQREVIKNSLFMQKSGIDCFYRKDTKTLSCDRFKKQNEKKVWKKLWLVYVAVPLPVPGCQRLSGILQFIFVREHLPIVIFYFYLYLYFTFKVTHLAIVVADLCKYLSEFVLSCKSEFIGLCMFVFHIYFSFLFRESFANQSC